MAIVEACVETLGEALAAQAGGAARIELCVNLREQGLAPPDPLIAACVSALTIPVFVMVRPRGGSFVYSPAEIESMRAQVGRAHALGAGGIVTGALTRAGGIDVEAMHGLVQAAAGLPVTCHRAFDATAHRDDALEALVGLGVARVLTSGGAATALQGREEIARLVQAARGRIAVVAAGGVRAFNVTALVASTGVTEVHAHVTTAGDVARLVRAADTASATPRRTSDGPIP